MSRPTIAAIATPQGTGAISMIRLSGPDSAALAAKVFRGKSADRWMPRFQHFGRIVSLSEEVIDEVLLTWFPKPHSFTGEDVIEISCHGGVLVTKRILDTLLETGAEAASPGEFSERAFLNGKLDLTQAEAIMDLISAQTDLAMKAANEQLSGRLGAEIERLRTNLIEAIAHVEAHIDFPEEDISPDDSSGLLNRVDGVIQTVNALLETANQGRILREGIKTVICGAPNAGKSSLLNRLLGFNRAIVNSEAGTTRDTIEEWINLNGIPLRLIDTAGIREGGEEVERDGIDRSRIQIAGAELILLVVDANAPFEPTGMIEIPERARFIRLFNKSDLPRHSDWEDTEGFPVSCLSESSIESLRNHLYQIITTGSIFSSNSLVAINARHQSCLDRARKFLTTARAALEEGNSPEFVAMDLRLALDAVGDIVGKTDIEEILGEVFSRFCIGK